MAEFHVCTPLPKEIFRVCLGLRSTHWLENYSPWHNTLVKVQGHEDFLIVKSRLVREAVGNEHFTAFWIEGDVGDGSAGYYSLIKNRHASTEPSKSGESLAPIGSKVIAPINLRKDISLGALEAYRCPDLLTRRCGRFVL